MIDSLASVDVGREVKFDFSMELGDQAWRFETAQDKTVQLTASQEDANVAIRLSPRRGMRSDWRAKIDNCVGYRWIDIGRDQRCHESEDLG